MWQFFTKLGYLLRETFLGLRRGGWMNWAAVSTVTVLLFLFGTGLQVSWQLNSILNQFGNQLEVSVYLNPGERGSTLVPVISNLPEVKEVKLISREEAWTSLIQELGSSLDEATEQLEGNPLVDELKVKAKSSEIVPILVQKLQQIRGIDEVQYVAEVLQRLQQLQQGLSWVSLVITAILSLTAIAVITTTIRLVVMARSQEIEIMQLVGATTVWITLPFLLQGIVFGLVGGAIAWAFILSIQQFIARLLTNQQDFLPFLTESLQLNLTQLLLLPIILLSLGGSVGLMGSLLAVRRFISKK